MDSLVRILLALTLSVVAVYSKPDLYVDPPAKHQFMQVNDAMKWTCNSKFAEQTGLTWTTPEGISASGPNLEIEDDLMFGPEREIVGMKSVLKIVKYSSDLSGGYSCQLKNKSNLDQLALNEYPIFLHTFTKENDDAMFSRENHTITLQCKINVVGAVVGEPVWKKGDIPVTELITEGSMMEPKGENLTIKDVMRSDAGQYIAEYPVEIDNDALTYKCKVNLNADPLVLDFEKSKNLIQEDNLELQCTVLGFPPPKVTWFKDGEPLLMNNSKRITLTDLNGVKNATLKIKSVDYDDAGEYKCMALSEALSSNSSKTVSVRVKDKFAALWPFLGIVCEVIVLCTIIFIYEKRRSRLAEQEEAAQDEPDGLAADRSEGLRHRNNTNSNPKA